MTENCREGGVALRGGVPVVWLKRKKARRNNPAGTEGSTVVFFLGGKGAWVMEKQIVGKPDLVPWREPG